MTDFITSGPLTVSPIGAHLISAEFPTGDILFLSSKAKFEEGSAIRGGVPLIAPWFGTLLDKQPSHGWARTTVWEVMDGEKVSAGLEKDGFELQVDIWRTDEGFEMTMGLGNQTDNTEKVQLAFHPYFRVGDIAETTVSGAEGLEVLDRLTDETATQEGVISFAGEYDRVVLGEPIMVINDGSRTIEVTGRGHDAMVVWNPAAERAAQFDDLGEDEWRNFVCVEPALLGTDLQGVDVEPGGSVSIGMVVKVSESS